MWTPLHAALGVDEGPLTFEMVLQAIDEQVPESAELDYKRDLPLPPGLDKDGKQAKQLELAKDVSAMANSGGGMLLYGVAEERSTGVSVASEVHSVGPHDEGVEKTIRQAVGTLVYPHVRGLRFDWLVEASPVEGSEPRVVLALTVPDSADRPHLVHRTKSETDWFAAPYRDGADTRNMAERGLLHE